MSNTHSPSRGTATWTWSERAGALTGAAYVLLVMVGSGIATGNQTNNPSGPQAVRYFAHADSTSARAGSAMEILGFVALALFVGWMAGALRRRSGPAPWLASAVVVGGTATIAVKLASVFPEIAAISLGKRLTPQLALVLDGQAGGGFVVSFLTFGIFMLAMGLSLLSTGLLGRIAAWTAVLLGVACIVVVMVSHTLNATPIPFLLGLLWILVVSVRLAVRPPRREAEQPEASPTPVPADAVGSF
jgi:hypothetical protein